LNFEKGNKKCKRISNGGRDKPAFAKRDKNQTMINIRGIPIN
jgi:hypothetical protein